MPLQGDGVRDNLCDGELTYFEGRGQNCTLKRQNQYFSEYCREGGAGELEKRK